MPQLLHLPLPPRTRARWLCPGAVAAAVSASKGSLCFLDEYLETKPRFRQATHPGLKAALASWLASWLVPYVCTGSYTRKELLKGTLGFQ